MNRHHLIHLATAFVLALALPVHAGEVDEVILTTNDLIYDSASGTIFASVPGSAGAGGNSITPIDPITKVVGAPVFVGSEPGPLAISNDGSSIYVGLDGSASVRRYDIPTATAGTTIVLGSDSFFGPYYAEDLAVQPGDADVLAVSRRYLGVSPRHAGVAVFDDGVELPDMTPGHTGSNRIEWSSDPGTVYGYNNETTEFGYRQMSVDATGIETFNTLSTSISGFGVEIHYHDGVVYATNGSAIHAVTGATRTYAGVFFADDVVADSARDRVYFLDGNTIKVYELSTFLFIEDIVVSGVSGNTSSLIRWGSDGLAFRTSGNQVFILSEEPLRVMEISPSAGRVLVTQNFDLAMLVSAPGTSVRALTQASVDGADVTPLLATRITKGLASTGEETLRYPGFGGFVARKFGAGTHTLDVTVTLFDGSAVVGSTTWDFVDAAE